MKDRIEAIVEQACAADTNIFGYGIWTHHILPVIHLDLGRLAMVLGSPRVAKC